MIDPRQHIGDVMNGLRLWQGWPVDDEDGQAERSRRVDLGAGALPSGIFGDDQINGVIAHQGKVSVQRERAAIHQQMVAGQCGWHVWRIDEAQQIMMLRLRGEGFDMHAPECEHDAAGRAVERSHRAGDVRHTGPAITLPRHPFRTGEHQVRDVRGARSGSGIGADRRSKGMGRVNEVSKSSRLQERGQPFSAAKAADTHRHRLGTGIAGPSGIAQHRPLAAFGQSFRQLARLGGAAQDQDVAHGN